ncbi:hypothetical protein E9993_15135 [Labilibacter sediminis]|nr:hypothetical protein E9993_15135 [Labilibacter sediminis]
MKEEVDFNQVYNKIQDLIHQGNNTISVLEDQIDIELQVEYFKQSKKIIKNLDKEVAFMGKDDLLDPNVDLDVKKELLLSIAKLDIPEAYRMLETYAANPDKELEQWSKLALQESKMVLETSLLGKAPIFISTGLGGQGDKLRYFMVLFGKEDKAFEEWQQNLVKTELEYSIHKHKGILENIKVDEDKVLVTSLLPIATNVQEAVSAVLNECNQMGEFLMSSFIVTNVKKLGSEEIQKMVDQYRSNTTTEE